VACAQALALAALRFCGPACVAAPASPKTL
jgi:hypothetical protein